MPIFNFGFNKADDKKKKRKKFDDPQIDVRFNRGQIFMFADETPQSASDPGIKYMGKFLAKSGYRITIGVYAETEMELEYKEDDVVMLSYVDTRAVFFFNARIIGIRAASHDIIGERFDIDPPRKDENQTIPAYDKYIFDVIPLTVPEKQQKREFFRMTLGIDIYYKLDDPDGGDDGYSLGSLTYNELKYELDHAKEGEDGYVKLRTIDLSAGGFRAKTRLPIESGKILECMIVVGFEALPATVKVLSAKQEDKNDIQNGLYDVRAIFDNMSDQVRDRIVRYIFAQQRQIQARQGRRQYEEDRRMPEGKKNKK